MANKTSRKSALHASAKNAVQHAKRARDAASTQAKQSAQKVRKRKASTLDKSERLHAYSSLSKKNARKDEKARKKAEYLATLPKSRVKRFFYRMHPKRFFGFWFSKQGGIMALKLTGISMAMGFVFLIALFAYFRRDLPKPQELSNRQLNQTTKFYDRTGKNLLFEVYGDQRREIVKYDQISENVKHATVAIEDKDFYKHGGFSFRGTLRAAVSNVTSGGEITQGGSTITQQFIKNSLLSNEQTVTRKIKELILSLELERLYSKDEILTFYLNEISYGGISYGIEAAAKTYFEKSANDLTLDEAALLAAMPQAPGDYSPYGKNTDLLVDRQKEVLAKMKEQDYIDKEQYDKALKVNTLKKIVPLSKQSAYKNVKAPHFVEKVKEILTEKYGKEIVENGGLKVITTLDLKLQKIAEESVANGIDKVVELNGDNAALTSIDVQTGQVQALVGSRDFYYPEYGSFNAASPELGRQPGSSFKPFGYAEMFKSDQWGPGSLIWDTNTQFLNGTFKPNNFDFKFPGKMKVREALGRSRNIPAVKALYIAGVDNTIELARDMGNKALCNTCDYSLALVLGAGEVRLDEHTHAYSTFARGGVYKEETYILKVEDSSGEVIEEWQDSEGKQVLDPQIAYLVSDMLKDDVARSATFGLGNSNLVVPGIIHTVKTGTTDLSVDGWMMGYSTCIATGVWVGNHDSRPMNSITSNQTGPIFTEYMRRSHEHKKCGQTDFVKPDGIKSVTLDSNTGRVATDKSRSTVTDLFPSWYKGTGAGQAKEVVIDTVSNKLATDCTPERAKSKVTESGVVPELPETDPEFSAWARSAPYGFSGSSTSEKDDVHKCNDKKPKVSIDVDKISAGKYRLTATVTQGTHPLDKLNFKVNGQIVSAQSTANSGSYSYIHTFTSSGSKTITAEVIDSVLYDDTANRSVSVGDITNPLEITSPADGDDVNGPNVNINWSSDNGADAYKLCISENGGGFNCTLQGASPTNETISVQSGKSYKVYVESYSGGSKIYQSSTVGFDVN